MNGLLPGSPRVFGERWARGCPLSQDKGLSAGDPGPYVRQGEGCAAVWQRGSFAIIMTENPGMHLQTLAGIETPPPPQLEDGPVDRCSLQLFAGYALLPFGHRMPWMEA